MSKKITRNVIDDVPTSKDLFHGKGHERTAISLARTIRYFDGKDRAIGLDGAWGSGKSSVVEIAERHLEEQGNSQDVHHHFFTFDIWKSQGAGFRRSFLEHFVSWAKESFPKKRQKLTEIEKSIHGKTREIQTNNHPVLGWFGIGVLFFLPLLPIYYFWAKSVYDEINTFGNRADFLCSWPFFLFLLFAASALLTAAMKKRASNGKLDFKTALSSVLLISSRQHQDHKVTQKVREVDPNDYEFHHTLREILGIVQSDETKVVVVLDNIDRLPHKEIKDYWALVRSIFSRAHQSAQVDPNKTITAIVPYDRLLIEINVNEDEGDGGKPQPQPLTNLSSREIFSKTFDDVLSVAPPVLSNAREFFTEKLEYALPKQVSKDDGFRTYRIFCELLRYEGGTTTPRQVVSFVNDLSGLFVLHEGRYPLPTFATYLAHQDMISNDPSVLNDMTNLNGKIIELASDPELPKHLAAMVFNVDTELAFQVLLDDKITSAVIATSPDELERLSKSSGFDLRVDDVVRSNLDEWRGTGDLKAAIENFGAVLPTYKGDSNSLVIAALVKGFEALGSFDIEESYEPYLTLIGLAPAPERPKVLRTFFRAAFAGSKSSTGSSFSSGQKFADFLSLSRQKLEKLDLVETMRQELATLSPNNDPEFLVGLAAGISQAGFGFSDFKSVKIDLPEEESFFADTATENPSLALLVFEQFKQARLLNNDNWIAVADACLSGCNEEEQEAARTANLLEVVYYAWNALPEAKRTEIDLSNAMEEGQFFRNLGTGETDPSEQAIANAFFLLGQEGLGAALGTPTKRHPQTQQLIQDSSDAFGAFNKLVLGEASLTKSQAIHVARKALDAGKVANPWISYGQGNPDHQAVEQVVRTVFSFDDPPRLNLVGLTLYFDYLQNLLGSEAHVGVLSKFGDSISAEQTSKIGLDDVPNGFLSATHQADGESWKSLHEHVEILLNGIERTDWTDHIRTMDHTAKLLIEKLATSGCSLESAKFREPLIQLVLDVLSGEVTPTADMGAIDALMSALDDRYLADIWRTVREKVSDVTPDSLANAVQLFPRLLSDLIQRGDRIMPVEKDNVVRHLLCPALEGRNRVVLDIFISMGFRRISNFKKASQESTTERLEGAMRSFSESGEDRTWIRRVTEAVLGKTRTRTIWDVWFGSAE